MTKAEHARIVAWRLRILQHVADQLYWRKAAEAVRKRLTFITIAESLAVPPYSIKRLVNHKMSNDVTAGHIAFDIERLRGSAQTIANYLLRAFDGEGRHVVPFPVAARNVQGPLREQAQP